MQKMFNLKVGMFFFENQINTGNCQDKKQKKRLLSQPQECMSAKNSEIKLYILNFSGAVWEETVINITARFPKHHRTMTQKHKI